MRLVVSLLGLVALTSYAAAQSESASSNAANTYQGAWVEMELWQGWKSSGSQWVTCQAMAVRIQARVLPPIAACIEVISGHTPPLVPNTALKLNIQVGQEWGGRRVTVV